MINQSKGTLLMSTFPLTGWVGKSPFEYLFFEKNTPMIFLLQETVDSFGHPATCTFMLSHKGLVTFKGLNLGWEKC